MVNNSEHWAERVARVAAASSTRYNPKPDYSLAADLGQAGLTGTEFDATTNTIMTMGDAQDEKLEAIQNFMVQAQQLAATAGAVAQARQEKDDHWSRKGFIGWVGSRLSDAKDIAGWVVDGAKPPEPVKEATSAVVEGAREGMRSVDRAILGDERADELHQTYDAAYSAIGGYPGEVVEGYGELTQVIDRAIATAVLATGEVADRNGYNIAARLDPENWTKAWEIAGNVTAGQALVDPHFMDDPYSAYQAGFEEETGRPLDAAYAELRHSSAAYNMTSGAVDFAKAWFADPLVVAGKGASVARAHYRGDLSRMGRGAQQKVSNILAASDSELAMMHVGKMDLVGQNALRLRAKMDEVRDQVRDNVRDGVNLVETEAAFKNSPEAAALFIQAAKARKVDPEDFRLLDEYDDDLYRDFVGASMGNGSSIARLQARTGEGSDLANSLQKMRETQIPQLDELARISREAYDDVRTDPSLRGYRRYERAMMAEKSMAQAMDDADLAKGILERGENYQDFVYRADNHVGSMNMVPGSGASFPTRLFDTVSTVYRPNRLAGTGETLTKVSPSALRRRPGYADFHRPGSLYESMSRYLEQALAYGGKTGVSRFMSRAEEGTSFERIRRDYLNDVLNATGRGASELELKHLAERGEDIGASIIAAKHGLELDDAMELLDAVRQRRRALHADILKRHGQDKPGDATIGKVSFDEGGHVQTLDLQLTVTQLKNGFMPTDLRHLDSFLHQHGAAISTKMRHRARAAAYEKRERATDILEGFNSYWKPATLFRLGYPIRTVSDDWLRAFAMVNSMTNMIGNSAAAFGIGVANLAPRTINSVRQGINSATRNRRDARVRARAADITNGDLPQEWALIDQARLGAINDRLGDIIRHERNLLNAQANGSKLPKGSRHPFISKLERLIAESDELAIDVATGRRLRASQEVHDFSLSRAQQFTEKPTGLDLAKYAQENADRLSHADGVLFVKKVDGGWRVGVGRKGPTYRKLNLIPQRSMTAGVRAGGHVFGAPAESGIADMYIPLASAEGAHRSILKANESTIAAMRAYSIDTGKVTTVNQPIDHARNWANTINDLLLPDPVYRRVMEMGPDETVRWLRGTPEGRETMRRNPEIAADPVAYTDKASNQLNLHLPDEGLRAKYMSGEKFTDEELLQRIETVPDQVPPALDRHATDLATGNGYFGKRKRKLVDAIYHVLASLPSDTLARNPFFRDQYIGRLQRSVDTLDAKYLDADGNIPQRLRQTLEKASREYALKQTRRYMFSLTDNTDLVHTMRFLSPFMGAWQETMIRWGAVLMERPEQVMRIWGQGWQNMEELWFLDMVDEQGRSADDPEHGELTNMRIPVPKWWNENVTKRIFGEAAADITQSFNINKNNMNAVFQGAPWWLPGGGPVLQLPAKALIGSQPHLKDEGAFQGFMWKYLFPTGVPEWESAVFPAGWMNQALTLAQGMEHTPLAVNIYKTDMVKWEAEGRIGPKPQESEAVKKAEAIQAMMIAGRFASPSAFQVEVGYDIEPFKVERNGELKTVPSQFFIDAARRIQAEETDWNAGMQRYTEEYGDDLYAFWSAATENITGIQATARAFRTTKEYEDLISDYPEVGMAIVGLHNMRGEYDYDVWKEQEKAGHRRRMAPAEAQAKAEATAGWAEWQKLSTEIDTELARRGLRSLNAKAAADLKFMKDRAGLLLAQQYPGWGRAREQIDTGRTYEVVRSLRYILESGRGPNPDVEPSWRGIRDYLDVHDEIAMELDRRGNAGGSRNITVEENADLQVMFDQAVGMIVLENPLFADLYHRLLERHELNKGSGADLWQS